MTSKEIRTALLKSGTRFTLKTKSNITDGVEFEMNQYNERSDRDWETMRFGFLYLSCVLPFYLIT